MVILLLLKSVQIQPFSCVLAIHLALLLPSPSFLFFTIWNKGKTSVFHDHTSGAVFLAHTGTPLYHVFPC